MIYNLVSFSGATYTGEGGTLRSAISAALSQLAVAELDSLAGGKSWCMQYVRKEATRRKGEIFSASGNYDLVELMEMLAETAIQGAASLTALRDVMAEILEALG